MGLADTGITHRLCKERNNRCDWIDSTTWSNMCWIKVLPLSRSFASILTYP